MDDWKILLLDLAVRAARAVAALAVGGLVL